MEAKVRASILRRMAAAGGLNVVCVKCGRRGKHVPGSRPRLRDRPCPKCGGRLRPEKWARTYPDRLLSEQRAQRNPGTMF